MADTLSSRVQRIIAGTASSIIGAIEDLSPEMIMEQAIVEVERTIEAVEIEKDRVLAGRLLIENRIKDAGEEYNKLAEDIEIATESGRDDLAKAGINRQLDIEAQVPVLKSSIEESVKEENENESFIAALQAKKREMQSDMVTFRKEADKLKAAQSNGASGNPRLSAKIKAERAGNAFDRMLTKTLGVGDRGTLQLQSASAKQLSELSDLSRSRKVEERLLEIKKEKQLESKS